VPQFGQQFVEIDRYVGVVLEVGQPGESQAVVLLDLRVVANAEVSQHGFDDRPLLHVGHEFVPWSLWFRFVGHLVTFRLS